MYVAYIHTNTHTHTHTRTLKDLNNDGVSREVDAPGEGGCAHQHLYQAIGEQPLHKIAILSQHAGMVYPKPVRKKLSKLLVTRTCHLFCCGLVLLIVVVVEGIEEGRGEERREGEEGGREGRMEGGRKGRMEGGMEEEGRREGRN